MQLQIRSPFDFADTLISQDMFGKSDPFLEFLRQDSGGHWQVVLRTEVGEDTGGHVIFLSANVRLNYVVLDNTARKAPKQSMVQYQCLVDTKFCPTERAVAIQIQLYMHT